MTGDELKAKELEILSLLSGLCSAPERDELSIAALQALLADVRAQQQERGDS